MWPVGSLQDLRKQIACMLCKSDIHTIRTQHESCTHRKALKSSGARSRPRAKGSSTIRYPLSAIHWLQPSTQLPSQQMWRGSVGRPESHFTAVTRGTMTQWKSSKISDQAQGVRILSIVRLHQSGASGFGADAISEARTGNKNRIFIFACLVTIGIRNDSTVLGSTLDELRLCMQ